MHKPDKPDKPPMDLIPGLRALARIAWALHRGNEVNGYEPGSWRYVDPKKFRKSCARHFFAWLDDPKAIDEETGCTHLALLGANILFLLWHGDDL